jgi:hypothetical protein
MQINENDYKWKTYGMGFKLKKQRSKRFFLFCSKRKIVNYEKSKIFPFKFWLKRKFTIHKTRLNGIYYYYAIKRPVDWILKVTMHSYTKRMMDNLFSPLPFFSYLKTKKKTATQQKGTQ